MMGLVHLAWGGVSDILRSPSIDGKNAPLNRDVQEKHGWFLTVYLFEIITEKAMGVSLKTENEERGGKTPQRMGGKGGRRGLLGTCQPGIRW